MKNSSKINILSALLVAGGIQGLMAESVESYLDSTFKSLEDAVPGKFNIDYRLRYEEFELPATETKGVSHRVRYGYTTENFNGFTAMVEGETVSRIGDDGAELHPLDNAGDGTDLNQAWVQYADKEYGKVKLGRQVYTLDDHRFIGHVGWRQNIQSFDAITGAFTGVKDLSVNGFFLNEQHAVNGTHNKLDAYGLNVSYAVIPELKLTAFGYSIEGEDVPANSNDTFGFILSGSYKIDEASLAYSISYATQDENSGPVAYDADYMAGDISGAFSGVTLGAGFEIFEPSFRTPLATVHKFNGYADALLPINGFLHGLEDYYIYAGYKIPVGSGIATKVIYHWFDSEDGAAGFDGGSEIDLVASYKVNKYTSLLAKYGDYNSDGGVGVGGLQGALDKRMFTFELNFVY